MDIRAAVLLEPGRVELREVARPSIGPDDVLVAPRAIGLQAARSAGIEAGASVVVLGAGPIGLMILQAARIRGATTLIAVDVAERPLAMAARLGATATLDGRSGE